MESWGSRWFPTLISQEPLVPVLTVTSECCVLVKTQRKVLMPLKDRLIQWIWVRRLIKIWKSDDSLKLLFKRRRERSNTTEKAVSPVPTTGIRYFIWTQEVMKHLITFKVDLKLN